MPSSPKLIKTYRNGNDWYKLYSDGWCEQGGKIQVTSNNQPAISFYFPFIDTNYTEQLTAETATYQYVYSSAFNRTLNGFQVSCVQGTSASSALINWEVKGYVAASTLSNISRPSYYYQVGNTIQDVEIITAAGALNDIADIKQGIFTAGTMVRFPIEVSSKDIWPAWWVKYSDGWIEQGGYISSIIASPQVIPLPIEFSDANYHILVGDSNIDQSNVNSRFCKVVAQTNTTFSAMGTYNNGAGTDYKFWWEAKGY